MESKIISKILPRYLYSTKHTEAWLPVNLWNVTVAAFQSMGLISTE